VLFGPPARTIPRLLKQEMSPEKERGESSRLKGTQKYRGGHTKKFITEEKYTKRKKVQCDFRRFGGEIAWDWKEKKERREASRGIMFIAALVCRFRL